MSVYIAVMLLLLQHVITLFFQQSCLSLRMRYFLMCTRYFLVSMRNVHVFCLHMPKLCKTISGIPQPGILFENGSSIGEHYLLIEEGLR